MATVLVCGEALIDLFVERADGATMPARAVPGGSPFNVAIGLARLGVGSGFLGGVSRDRFGAFLAGRLEEEGVDTSFLVRSDRPTTLSAIVTGPDGQPGYSFYGGGAADRGVEIADLPSALPSDVQALSFGSYSMAVEPVGSTFAELAEREQSRRVISVDPNLRASVVGDLALWRARMERFCRCATIVKASDEDVRSGWEGQLSPEAAAENWLDLGARLVVITRGGEGATGFHAAGSVSIPARTVAVVDTVGAGDSFHAALLAGLARSGRLNRDAIAGLDPVAVSELLEYAAAAAALTVGRHGADLPRAVELPPFLS